MSLLVSTAELATQLIQPDVVVVDVRWEPNQPEAGFRSYQEGHIPGAIYIDLDCDLSDRSDLSRGRHPLPHPQTFVKTLARHGIGCRTRLIVYDDKWGSLAARLWWMMRWIGAPEAAVLDGGFAKWVAEGRPVEKGSGRTSVPATDILPAAVNPALIATMEELETAAGDSILLLDARAPERYRGEVEPIDSRAGHIPGALNAPWTENLTAAPPQVFKAPHELRTLYQRLGVTEGKNVVCYCGSGVTSCHNILALELAGFSGARLYPGSWSEWIIKHP